MDSFVKYTVSAGILLLFLLTGMPDFAHASESQTAENNPSSFHIETDTHNATDSLPAPHPVHERLQDPDFDVRFNRGKLQPWHDIKSVYPRRTIPMSLLATIPYQEKLLTSFV